MLKKTHATPAHVRRVANRKTPRDLKAKRNHRRPAINRTAGLQDAPIEAWQQAMLPHLQQLAQNNGFDGIGERAFVFLSLLRLKPFSRITEFEDWVHRVTGYPLYEIRAFVARAKKGFLIIDGQPSEDAFLCGEHDEEIRLVNLVLMIQVLEGKLCRNARGEYSLPEETV